MLELFVELCQKFIAYTHFRIETVKTFPLVQIIYTSKICMLLLVVALQFCTIKTLKYL